MTIQQTLKIVDGRLTPSTDVLDASLLEISSELNNLLQVKEDGLFVLNENSSSTTVSEITYIDSTDMQTVIKTETGQVASRVFKIKRRQITEDEVKQPAAFLDIFKDILEARYTVNNIQRDQGNGSNTLVQEVYTNPNITKVGGNYMLRNVDFHKQPLDQIPSDFQINKINPGATHIEFPFSRFGDFICEVYLDGVLIEQKEEGTEEEINIVRNYDTNMISLRFSTPVVDGQLIKVTYKPFYGYLYSSYKETENITFTVGSSEEPVLNLIRPPLTDYSAEIEYGTLYITGVLK